MSLFSHPFRSRRSHDPRSISQNGDDAHLRLHANQPEEDRRADEAEIDYWNGFMWAMDAQSQEEFERRMGETTQRNARAVSKRRDGIRLVRDNTRSL